jgi:hypothetical protein
MAHTWREFVEFGWSRDYRMRGLWPRLWAEYLSSGGDLIPGWSQGMPEHFKPGAAAPRWISGPQVKMA